MRRLSLAGILCLLITAPYADADIIYLKNGNVLEVDDAVVKGDFVEFGLFNVSGRMSIELLAVERIEKTAARQQEMRLSGGIGGPV
jgi:hypothetical protein